MFNMNFISHTGVGLEDDLDIRRSGVGVGFGGNCRHRHQGLEEEHRIQIWVPRQTQGGSVVLEGCRFFHQRKETSIDTGELTFL